MDNVISSGADGEVISTSNLLQESRKRKVSILESSEDDVDNQGFDDISDDDDDLFRPAVHGRLHGRKMFWLGCIQTFFVIFGHCHCHFLSGNVGPDKTKKTDLDTTDDRLNALLIEMESGLMSHDKSLGPTLPVDGCEKKDGKTSPSTSHSSGCVVIEDKNGGPFCWFLC